MRWLTIPLRRESDVVSARSRLRAWAEATGLEGMLRTRAVTVGAELARVGVATRDGSIEFGWEKDIQRPWCVIDLPTYAKVPKQLVDEELVRSADGRTGDRALRFDVDEEDNRTRYRFLADLPTDAHQVQTAVADAQEATAVEMLKEQNLEMARMIGTLRDHEAELVRALDESRRNANEATARALAMQELSKKKDEFLAIASHDVRSPIAAAKGALELLEPTLKDLNDDQRHLLGVARRAADSVTHLLANLLSTALIEGSEDDEIPPQLIDMTEVAREVIDLMAVQARHKGVEVTFEGTEATVLGDLMWIRQVIANLVNNAIKFTPKGGHVGVKIGREGDQVVFSVEDDGVGIPPDKADRVFEKLVKLRPRGTAGERGTGIGLYVTKQLVDRLGGTIRILPRATSGTRFEVRIPRVEGQPLAITAE
ncbi:MAG: sensor histidine kinase [Polyangiales bacterium]